MIQTRSQTKASGVQLPEVHGSRKGLYPHKIPEKQPQPIVRPSIEKKPRLGQGRAGVRRKVKLALPSQNTGPGSSESKPIVINSETVSAVDPILPKPIPRSEVLPAYLLPQNRPPPKPPDQLINKQDIGNTKMDIEENSPFQENIISDGVHVSSGPGPDKRKAKRMKRGSSAGGLKVKVLGQTPRDAGLSPAWCYTYCLYLIHSKRK